MQMTRGTHDSDFGPGMSEDEVRVVGPQIMGRRQLCGTTACPVIISSGEYYKVVYYQRVRMHISEQNNSPKVVDGFR